MTAIQSLKELAYKITGKTPKSNTENGVITELAEDYTNNSNVVILEGIFLGTNPAQVRVNLSFDDIYSLYHSGKIVYISIGTTQYKISRAYKKTSVPKEYSMIAVDFNASSNAGVLSVNYLELKSRQPNYVIFYQKYNFISFNS